MEIPNSVVSFIWYQLVSEASWWLDGEAFWYRRYVSRIERQKNRLKDKGEVPGRLQIYH